METPGEVARGRHHEDAGCENGDLEQHAAPPERGSFERERKPALEVDEKSHLHEDAAKDENKVRDNTGVLVQFHKASYGGTR